MFVIKDVKEIVFILISYFTFKSLSYQSIGSSVEFSKKKNLKNYFIFFQWEIIKMLIIIRLL